ncbi:MAG: M42 family metallopeptidase [Coriobacteriia bacterium]
MRAESERFLKMLVEAPSPSGYEQPAASVFREYVSGFADEVATDVLGTVRALVKGSGEGPTLMLAGHVDEVGFMVTYVTDEGFLSFKTIGGIDAHLMPGSRVLVHTKEGPLPGVMGRQPIHLLEKKEREKVAEVHKLFIDLGLPVEAVRERVRVGDPVTFAVGFEEFGDGLAVSRAFDDKVGAWVAAEAARMVKDRGGASGDVWAVATVQEEIGGTGASAAAYSLDPEVGIVIEVGHATDYPDMNKRRYGDYKLGAGPIITRGANINPTLFEMLIETAEAEGIPYQLDGCPGRTPTDADSIQVARSGRATALVSVPLRYMHTPTEVISLEDLENTAALIAALAMRLEPGRDFTP